MSAPLAAQQSRSLVTSAKDGAVTIGASVAVLWLVFLAQVLSMGLITQFGIVPRTAAGLVGVLITPFLHGSLAHLIGNSIGFVLLAPLAMLRSRKDFWVVTVISALTSGLGCWLLGGAGVLHVGASGVIFGYLGFLMARGLFERRAGAVVLSILVTWMYGSAMWGMVPIVAGAGVSWLAHLFGFLGGIGTARLLGRELRKKR